MTTTALHATAIAVISIAWFSWWRRREAQRVQSPQRQVVRWGIVGVGDVCEVKAGPGFYKAARSRLVSVMRRSADKAAEFAKRHNVPKSSSSVEAVVHDDEVDAVYVASPVANHKEHAFAALRAGKPTLVEKPLARCAEEALEIVTAFREAQVPLYCAYYRRAHDTWVKLKEMLDSRGLGDVSSVEYSLKWAVPSDVFASIAQGGEIPWRFRPEVSGGGLVMDVGSHVVDLLEFLFGELTITHASASQSRAAAAVGLPVEDLVELEFISGDGRVKGKATWDFAQPQGSAKSEILRVVGSEQVAEARPLASDGLHLTSVATGKTRFLDLPPPKHVHQNFIQAIVDELLVASAPEGRYPTCSGEQGLRATKMIDACLWAFYGHRRVGFWES